MKRSTWDTATIGSTIVTRSGTFKIAWIERYFRSAVAARHRQHTVVRIENDRHESMHWGHYLLSGATLIPPVK